MKRKRFITIGTFDGVHAGHRFLFNRLDVLCAQYGLKPLVLYFPFPPKTLLSAQPAMTVLTTPDEKHALLKTATDAQIERLDFQAYREYTPEQFFKQVLVKKHNVGGLLVGKDFAFGKARAGHADFLLRQCQRLNIPFVVSDFCTTDGMKISSSLIRKTLAEGKIPEANQMLCRPYSVQGRVVQGQKLGRKLGYPTANLDTGFYKILPHGVFAVWVKLGKQFYKGFCNIGFRPTVNPIHSNIPLVEVNIFDFNKSIYGRKLTVFFEAKIRAETKFDGLESLKKQLAQDKLSAEKLLVNPPAFN